MYENNTRNLLIDLSSSQTSNNTCFSYYLLCFSSAKSEKKRAKQVLPRCGGGKGEVAQITYIHIRKCKNDFKKVVSENMDNSSFK
jgi:hypothetical protein